MKREERIVRRVRTVIDDGRMLVVETLREMDVLPTDSQIDDFMKWRIKNEWKQYKDERMANYVVEQNKLNDLPLFFPNGKKGVLYRSEIKLDITNYELFWLEDLDSHGLSWYIHDDGTVVIEGVSIDPQSFEFKLCIKVKGWQPGDPILERKFNISFNPDPRELWRSLPVPPDLPFQKNDEENAFVLVPEIGGMRQKCIVAASKRGRSHAQEGKPRDDDFRVSFDNQNGWYMLAVADGAGSAKYSREGSRIASETVERYCHDKLAEQSGAFESAIQAYADNQTQENLTTLVEKIHEILFKAATEAHRAIVKKVDECKETAVLKDFSTTLLLAVCRKFSFGWFVASFGVGDGAIAIYDKNTECVKLLNEPDGGEYAGQTRFLTMESIFRDRTRIKMSIVPDFTALMLMSDGISDPFFETDANLAKKEKWDELWQNLSKDVDFSADNAETKDQLLKWLDFWSPGNHDDRTIAILY